MAVPTSRPDRLPARRAQAKLVGAAAAGALAVLFAVLNLDEVAVNWVVATWETPLIVVIAVSFALGAATGLLVARRRG